MAENRHEHQGSQQSRQGQQKEPNLGQKEARHEKESREELHKMEQGSLREKEQKQKSKH